MNRTITYYNTHAKQFTADTIAVVFSKVQERFTTYLQMGDLILDFGCGSGRDSLAFIQRGYAVESIDGTEELSRIAR